MSSSSCSSSDQEGDIVPSFLCQRRAGIVRRRTMCAANNGREGIYRLRGHYRLEDSLTRGPARVVARQEGHFSVMARRRLCDTVLDTNSIVHFKLPLQVTCHVAWLAHAIQENPPVSNSCPSATRYGTIFQFNPPSLHPRSLTALVVPHPIPSHLLTHSPSLSLSPSPFLNIASNPFVQPTHSSRVNTAAEG